jgi:hypothetical protein
MTRSISLFVIIPYSIGKNRVASSPNRIKIKVFSTDILPPIVELRASQTHRIVGGEGFVNLPRQNQDWKLLKSKKIRDPIYSNHLPLGMPFCFSESSSFASMIIFLFLYVGCSEFLLE